ncbi:hypothetical protein FJTKL_13744 [Diaporthe vaccinii]|uniref:Uncharacterized protein n=1 Tax=Diaporthe vaccinii TaxID=105482 RepID=A0ABR4F8M1_9PEZI
MQRRQTGIKQETSPQEPPGILPLSKSHNCRIPPDPRYLGDETRQTEKLLLVRLHQVEPSRPLRLTGGARCIVLLCRGRGVPGPDVDNSLGTWDWKTRREPHRKEEVSSLELEEGRIDGV